MDATLVASRQEGIRPDRPLAAGRAFTRFLDEILDPAVGRDRSEGKGYARARAIVSETRKKLLADEKGIEAALLEASRS